MLNRQTLSTRSHIATVGLCGFGLLLVSACSRAETCESLDATALEASARYDAATEADDIAEAKADFDDAIGKLIDLEC